MWALTMNMCLMVYYARRDGFQTRLYRCTANVFNNTTAPAHKPAHGNNHPVPLFGLILIDVHAILF